MPKTRAGTVPAGKSGGKKPIQNAKNGKYAQQDAANLQRKRNMFMLFAVIFFLALAIIALCPGGGFLLKLRSGVWGLFGLPLIGWYALAIGCCAQWARERSLKSKTVQTTGRALLLLSIGGLMFLLANSAGRISGHAWGDLVSSSFQIMETAEEGQDAAKLDLWATLANGGFLSSLAAAALAKNCGKPGSIVIYVFLLLCCLPMAFPRLWPALVNKLEGPKEEEEADPPAEAEAAAREGAPEEEPQKKGLFGLKSRKRKQPPEKNERNERRHEGNPHLADTQPLPPLPPEYRDRNESSDIEARRQLFRDFQTWQLEGGEGQVFPLSGREGSLPDTVIEELGEAVPGPEVLAGRIASDNPVRAKAQKAGEDAAIKALMADAAAAAAAPVPAVYLPPPVKYLDPPRNDKAKPDRAEEEMIERKLLRTLESFGVAVDMVGRSRGPAVTRYELLPAEGVKISKITSLSDDIALRLAAQKVRIEAPIPGKAAVGVEVPNKVRAVVSLKELVESDTYRAGQQKSRLTVALGKDIVGNFVCADLAKLPHLLIAGTTGSGKSVCMNALIVSLLYNASPAQVKMIMVDPKQVEFTVYTGIPHLLVPVVSDPLKAAGALGWAVNEMERRYGLISEQNVRDLDSYNAIAEKRGNIETMAKVVIFIDELSDLMMVAPSDVEDSIQRLTQKGRAAGIHLVVATQRPSVDVITGVIKSNLPGRIALSVASQIDSRTIINSAGAEQLLGNGDMLFSLNGGNNAVRVQGCYVSDPEVQRVTKFVRDQSKGELGYDDTVWEEIERNAAMAGSGKRKGGGMLAPADDDEADDPMLGAAVEVVVDAQMASTTMLQKKLKLGYARASRLVDLLEEKGIVGPPEGSKPRKVLIGKAQWLEIQANGGLAAAAQPATGSPQAQQQPASAIVVPKDDDVPWEV